jgi:hypothetical protein
MVPVDDLVIVHTAVLFDLGLLVDFTPLHKPQNVHD